ncbi:hypothetical protein K8Q94_00640 [Candidatus Nomurabacteria bacterium]|nr:hypothetical protein [Candidatus Nomurabacteria bacterium]
MKKITLIIIGAIAVISIGGFILYFFWFIKPEKEIAEKCQGFTLNWTDFIDCHGIVSIHDGWDMDYLSIDDHMHDYEIARVYNQNQYIFSDNKVFVKNLKTIEGSSYDGLKTEYYQRLFQDGEVVRNFYDAVSDIPTYLVVDIVSGEAKAYKAIIDVPEAEKAYFEDLEKR